METERLQMLAGTTRNESSAGVAMLTLLRLVVGVIMTAHGWQKLTGFAQWKQNVIDLGIPLPDLAAPLAVAGELAGGLGLLLGLLTPIAALGVLGTMAMAIVAVHLPNGLFAQNNGFEYPLTLFCVALFFLMRGPGPHSVDALLARGQRKLSTPAQHSETGRDPAHQRGT